MKKNKVIVQLAGGLGNQMFMYAIARSISLELNYDLYIDTVTGFIKDKEYCRHFELDNFNIRYNEVYGTKDSYCFIAGNIIQKISRRIGWHLLCPYKKYIIENNHKLNENLIPPLNFNHDIFIEGYWQNEMYFKKYQDEIRKDFTIKKKLSKISEKDLAFIKSEKEKAVALCIRRYQEAKNLSFEIENEFFYHKAIEYYINKLENPIFFIFTQAKKWVTDNIIIKYNNIRFTFITEKDKAHEDLFLLSTFKYFIISNSTFYWWGAWLSKEGNKQIICSDKFINKGLEKSEWIYLK